MNIIVVLSSATSTHRKRVCRVIITGYQRWSLVMRGYQRTSSRTHFEVLGLGLQVQVLGLEASSPRKLACPRLEDSTIFWIVKILWSAWKFFRRTFFRWDRLKNVCEDFFLRSPEKFFWRPYFFFFWRALALVSLVLDLESVCSRKGCPWPWPRALCTRLHLCWLWWHSTVCKHLCYSKLIWNGNAT